MDDEDVHPPNCSDNDQDSNSQSVSSHRSDSPAPSVGDAPGSDLDDGDKSETLGDENDESPEEDAGGALDEAMDEAMDEPAEDSMEIESPARDGNAPSVSNPDGNTEIADQGSDDDDNQDQADNRFMADTYTKTAQLTSDRAWLTPSESGHRRPFNAVGVAASSAQSNANMSIYKRTKEILGESNHHDANLTINDEWLLDPSEDKKRFKSSKKHILSRLCQDLELDPKDDSDYESDADDGAQASAQEDSECPSDVESQKDRDDDVAYRNGWQINSAFCINLPIDLFSPDAQTIDDFRTSVPLCATDGQKKVIAERVRCTAALMGLIETDNTMRLGTSVQREDKKDDGDVAQEDTGERRKKAKQDKDEQGPWTYYFADPKRDNAVVGMRSRSIEILLGKPHDADAVIDAVPMHQMSEEEQFIKDPMRPLSGRHALDDMVVVGLRVWWLVFDPSYDTDFGLSLMMGRANSSGPPQGAHNAIRAAFEVKDELMLKHTYESHNCRKHIDYQRSNGEIMKPMHSMASCATHPLAISKMMGLHTQCARTEQGTLLGSVRPKCLQMGMHWHDGKKIEMWDVQCCSSNYIEYLHGAESQTGKFFFAPSNEITNPQVNLFWELAEGLSLFETRLPPVTFNRRTVPLELRSCFVHVKRQETKECNYRESYDKACDANPFFCEGPVTLSAFNSLMHGESTELSMHNNDLEGTLERSRQMLNGGDACERLHSMKRRIKHTAPRQQMEMARRPQRELRTRLKRVYEMVRTFVATQETRISELAHLVSSARNRDDANHDRLRKLERHLARKRLWFNKRRATVFDAYFRFGITEVEHMIEEDRNDLPPGLMTRVGAAMAHIASLEDNSPVNDLYGHVNPKLSAFGSMMQETAYVATHVLGCPSVRAWNLVYFKSFDAIVDELQKFIVTVMGAPGGGKSTLMEMLSAVTLPGTVVAQGSNTDVGPKQGFTSVDGTCAIWDELPPWMKPSSDYSNQVNDRKQIISDGRSMYTKCKEIVGDDGRSQHVETVIETPHSEQAYVCCNTGWGLGASMDKSTNGTSLSTEFEGLVDRCLFLFWRNLVSFGSDPVFRENVRSEKYKDVLDRQRTRESLVVLMLVIRNCVPGYDCDYSVVNSLFDAMDMELVKWDVVRPNSRELHTRRLLTRTMAMGNAAHMVFMLPHMAKRFPDIHCRDGKTNKRIPFNMLHLRHCVPFFASPTPEMAVHAMFMQLASSPKADPTLDNIMHALMEHIDIKPHMITQLRKPTIPQRDVMSKVDQCMSKQKENASDDRALQASHSDFVLETEHVPIGHVHHTSVNVEMQPIHSTYPATTNSTPISLNSDDSGAGSSSDPALARPSNLDDIEQRKMFVETQLSWFRDATNRDLSELQGDIKRSAIQAEQDLAATLPTLAHLSMSYTRSSMAQTLGDHGQRPFAHMQSYVATSSNANNVAQTAHGLHFERRKRSRVDSAHGFDSDDDSSNAANATGGLDDESESEHRDFTWILTQLGKNLPSVTNKLCSEMFLKSMEMPQSVVHDGLRLLAKRDIRCPCGPRHSYRSFELFQKANMSNCMHLDNMAMSSGSCGKFVECKDMLYLPSRHVMTLMSNRNGFATFMYDWSQRAADMACLRGDFGASTTQLCKTKVMVAPLIKFDQRKDRDVAKRQRGGTSDGAEASGSDEGDSDCVLKINTVGIERHAIAWAESCLLLSRMRGVGNYRDPKMEQGTFRSDPQLPLLFDGLLLAKVIKSVVNVVWHHKTSNMDSALLDGVITLPVHSPRDDTFGELLCIDPFAFSKTADAMHELEKKVRRTMHMDKRIDQTVAESTITASQVFPSCRSIETAQSHLKVLRERGASNTHQTSDKVAASLAGGYKAMKRFKSKLRADTAKCTFESYATANKDPWFSETLRILKDVGQNDNGVHHFVLNNMRLFSNIHTVDTAEESECDEAPEQLSDHDMEVKDLPY